MLTYPGLESQLDQELNTKRTELRTKGNYPQPSEMEKKRTQKIFQVPGLYSSFSLKPLETLAAVISDSLQPHGLWPTWLLCPWDSPGKNTRVGCHSLLQGIFLTQGLNLGLPHCRQILYHLSHLESPFICYSSANLPLSFRI